MPTPQETPRLLAPELPETLCSARIAGRPWSHDKQPPAVWVYRLHKPAWQQAVLTSDGMFSVVGDYGNYAYMWSNWGDCDFRQFFGQIDGGYLLRKIAGSREEYDEEATVRSVRKTLVEAYKDRTFSKREMREVLGALGSADLSHPRGVEAFWEEEIERDSGKYQMLGDIFDWAEIGAIYCHDRDAQAYCEKMRPALQQAIRDQLAREARGQTA